MAQQVSIRQLSPGNVVICQDFAYARQWTRFPSDPLTVVPKGQCISGYGIKVDQSRGAAPFMVMHSMKAGETTGFGGPGSVWTEVYLVRLDAMNQPGDEVIKTADMDMMVSLVGCAHLTITPAL